jgi:hypothetical protein
VSETSLGIDSGDEGEGESGTGTVIRELFLFLRLRCSKFEFVEVLVSVFEGEQSFLELVGGGREGLVLTVLPLSLFWEGEVMGDSGKKGGDFENLYRELLRRGCLSSFDDTGDFDGFI